MFEPQALKIIAIILFALTYVALLVFAKYRSFIALGTAVVFVIIGVLPFKGVFTSIDFNLLLMLGGIMGTVALFIDSKMTEVIGDKIIKKSPSLKWAIVMLSVVSGVISAFVDNVATVLILAPIALDISKKANISPVKPMIAIAIMSNLEGAATLVGDTTSILLGAQANMNFFEFFFFKGKIGLFFVVQASLLLTTLYLVFVFRKFTQKIEAEGEVKAVTIVPSLLLLGTISLLIIGSFLQPILKFDYLNGSICVGMFLIGFVHNAVKNKDRSAQIKPIKEIDYMTLLLLASLFVIIGGVSNVGFINDIAHAFTRISANPLVIYVLIVGASVILSAFIDNIPYVAAMLPVAASIASTLSMDPYLLYFGLVCGATLGGNLTPIGASANITAMGILRKEGHNVSVGEFMKISIPFTLIAVVSGCALVWFIWS